MPPHNGPWAHPTTLEDLRRPLRVPEPLQARGLTRSQLIFSMGTSVDPRALKITGDDEFYLFMDQRAQHGWTSFGMTTQKWASAAKLYNAQLEELGKKKHTVFIKKNPRALMEKLGEIEPKILDRVARNNYSCTLHIFLFTIYLYLNPACSLARRGNRSETFWRRHCYAVPALIGKVEMGAATGSNLDTAADNNGGSTSSSPLKKVSSICR